MGCAGDPCAGVQLVDTLQEIGRTNRVGETPHLNANLEADLMKPRLALDITGKAHALLKEIWVFKIGRAK
jgi:hypothetical protein